MSDEHHVTDSDLDAAILDYERERPTSAADEDPEEVFASIRKRLGLD